MSRIDKLTKIEKRDLEIEAIINASKYSILFSITKLNSERLSGVIKRNISNVARSIARQEVSSSKVEKADLANEIYDENFYFYSRLLTRAAVATLRSTEIQKYKTNPSTYKFIKKI